MCKLFHAKTGTGIAFAADLHPLTGFSIRISCEQLPPIDILKEILGACRIHFGKLLDEATLQMNQGEPFRLHIGPAPDFDIACIEITPGGREHAAIDERRCETEDAHNADTLVAAQDSETDITAPSFVKAMDDWAARDKTLPDLIARNKRAILAALAQHNVASAQVLFEGYADSGQVEDPDFAFNGPECDLSSVAVPFESCLRPDDIQIKNMPLNKAITSLCYDILEHRHGGWEINEGSDGFFFFDAKTQKLEFNFAYKVREETCTEI